jgi:4-hydroxybenzoate polyprenyltransferase
MMPPLIALFGGSRSARRRQSHPWTASDDTACAKLVSLWRLKVLCHLAAGTSVRGRISRGDLNDQASPAREILRVHRHITMHSVRTMRGRLGELAWNLWLITKDDTPTFVVPNSVFGLGSALSGSCLASPQATTWASLIPRIPWVLLFNWTNLLIFDLANQRLPESVKEDSLNKPWRPIPSGRLTSTQVRRGMLFAIPLVLLFNHYILGTGVETALLYGLTWLYNDLGGGDENWIVRNVIIACAFGFYNVGSLKVAAGSAGPSFSADLVQLSTSGYIWTFAISAVILTTMHVQDLKDQDGDRARGRRTAPLTLGNVVARWTLAVPVLFWTRWCTWFWGLGWLVSAPPAGLGAYVAWRCLYLSGAGKDRITWQLWCLWTALLYLMPAAR